jgi:histidyl-tRNA synthetase
VDVSGRKIKNTVKYADKVNIGFLMVIGDKEIATGIIKVKNLIERTEKTYRLQTVS